MDAIKQPIQQHTKDWFFLQNQGKLERLFPLMQCVLVYGMEFQLLELI